MAWFVVLFGINTTSDISKLLYVISRAARRVKFETILECHEWYHVQIMLLFAYTTTRKGFVIFTCRYFKFSWNTTALMHRLHVSGNLWNAFFFLRIRLASTRIQRIFRQYPEIFENALQSGHFFIRYEYVYVWTVVSGNFRIRFRHSLGSSLHGEHYKQTWRTARL